MPGHSDPDKRKELRDKIIGLGDKSIRKSHYSKLQKKIDELQLTEEKLQAYFNATNEAIFVHDAETTDFIDVNSTAERIYGMTREELLNSTVTDLSVLEAGYNTERAAELWEKTLAGDPQVSEWLARKKDGTPFWVEISMSAATVCKHKRIIVVVRDINERMRAELALKASEERFKFAMEACKDGIWDWDLETDSIYYSPAYAEMLGYTLEDLLQDDHFWKTHIHPDDEALVHEGSQACIENRNEFFHAEFRMKARDGSWRWIMGRAKATSRDASGRAKRMIGTHTDITDLRQATQLINSFFEQRMTLQVVADLDGIIQRVNQSWKKILGYTDDELQGSVFMDQVHPDDVATTQREMQRLKEGTLVDYFENRYRHKDGTYRTLAWSANASLEEELIYAVAKDITEEVETRAALMASERLFENAIESLPIAICLFSGDEFTTLYTNPACESILGYSTEDIPSLSEWWAIAYPDPDYCQEVMEEWNQRIKAATKHEFKPYETRVACKDGGIKYILWGYIELEDRKFIYGLDLTDRKSAEQKQEQHYQELELFNKMAVGRELRMIELKAEINTLNRELNRAEPYQLEPKAQSGGSN